MKTQHKISRPVYLLQAEALLLLFAASGAYRLLFPHHWLFVALLFLVPDLSLLLFVRGTNATAVTVYNVVHSYVLPLLLGIAAAQSHNVAFGEVSLIWICHISLDRMLGYGLKYPTSFKFTHMQSAGSLATPPALTNLQHIDDNCYVPKDPRFRSLLAERTKPCGIIRTDVSPELCR